MLDKTYNFNTGEDVVLTIRLTDVAPEPLNHEVIRIQVLEAGAVNRFNLSAYDKLFDKWDNIEPTMADYHLFDVLNHDDTISKELGATYYYTFAAEDKPREVIDVTPEQ